MIWITMLTLQILNPANMGAMSCLVQESLRSRSALLVACLAYISLCSFYSFSKLPYIHKNRSTYILKFNFSYSIKLTMFEYIPTVNSYSIKIQSPSLGLLVISHAQENNCKEEPASPSPLSCALPSEFSSLSFQMHYSFYQTHNNTF